MAILIMLNQVDPALVERPLKSNPDCPEIRVFPDTGDVADIECIVVWKHEKGVLNNFPNLKLIASYGAGVENILSDSTLPENVPIVRFVDDTLSERMAEFILAAILNHKHNLTFYREQQAAALWRDKEFVSGRNVTILGLGQLGIVASKLLDQNGFKVSGWARSGKNIQNVTSYSGRDQLFEAVKEADFIVCLLPLTAETNGILNNELFSNMKKGSFLINVGRGDHVNETDLLKALANEHLSGALLDVFSVEPLPKDHPFWRHPKIHVTPHISSPTDKGKLARHILDNYNRMKNGEPLLHEVDPKRSY